MIPVRTFCGKKAAVFGLARSGLAAIHALRAGGAEVVAWDDDEEKRGEAAQTGAEVENLYEADWATIDACILSPGVPLTHPAPHTIVTKAQENDIEVIGDLELFARELSQALNAPKLICITGTNGKSTTTSLVGHVLSESGVSCDVGGNIGEPALALSEFAAHKKAYALEVSSYQLDLSPSLKPDVSVLLNISPDHLDRHGGMNGYVSSKKKIFKNQASSETAVVSVDDPYTSEICTELSQSGIGQVIPISVGKALSKGVYVIDGILFDGLNTPAVEVADLHECPNLLGHHNWQNAAAGFAVGKTLGIASDVIVRALMSFSGLPHRLELIIRLNGVRFINDSKATNVDAARQALSAFDNIYWIAGGRSKTNSLDSLQQYLPRVKHAYLIGESAESLSGSLDGLADCKVSGTLTAALHHAYEDARRDGVPDPVILLSPACASFDQFSDFEDRGDQFRRAVQDLVAHEDRGGAAA